MSAARRLWARSAAGCDRVASLPDRCVHGLVRDRGRGVDGQSPVGDFDADVADPFDPLDVVATMLGANLGGRLIATVGAKRLGVGEMRMGALFVVASATAFGRIEPAAAGVASGLTIPRSGRSAHPVPCGSAPDACLPGSGATH